MKIYNVTYIHCLKNDVYDETSSFLDMSDATKFYERKRKLAVDTAKDEDSDSDEEVYRDFQFNEQHFHLGNDTLFLFRCVVPDDDESFVVRLSVCDAK